MIYVSNPEAQCFSPEAQGYFHLQIWKEPLAFASQMGIIVRNTVRLRGRAIEQMVT